MEEDLNVVRRWNQQDLSDGEADPILPSGRHMGYAHRRHHDRSRYGHARSFPHRYRHHRDAYGRFAGDAVDHPEDMPAPHRLAHRDRFYSDERPPAGAGFVSRYFDDDADIDPADLAGLDLDYRRGPRPSGDPYLDDAAPMPAAQDMMLGDEQDEDPGYQLPIDWKTSKFRFRKEVSLESLNAHHVRAIVINFNDTYKNNKSVQDLLASGAYLGPVSVGGLRASNSHVTFTVRGESRPNHQLGYGSVPIKEADEYLPNVSRVAHAVIPKRGPSAADGIEFSLRDTAAVTPTWLSGHPDFTVHTLGNDIKETLTKGVDEISIRHPIAQWLIAQGRLPDEDLQEHDTVHVDHQDVMAARRAIEAEERNNPKIGDARSLQLVIGRAYAEKQAAGVPQWTDTAEIADDYPIDKRTTTLIKTRQAAPIVIEGYWKIQHGHPVMPAMMEMVDEGEGLEEEHLEDLEAFE